MNQRKDILEKEQQIHQWIANNESMAFMAKQLQCKVDTLKRYLKKMNITYAGNQGGKGKKSNNQYMTALEYMNSDCVKGAVLRDKLIRDGLKDWKCECCNNTEWLGEPIALEIHHKDGNHYHNELDNIELICPNCHALRHRHM